MVPYDDEWTKILDECRREGFRVFPLDAATVEKDLREFADDVCPDSVLRFRELWIAGNLSPWQVVIGSGRTVSTQVMNDLLSQDWSEELVYPLHSLVDQADHAAIIWGNSRTLISPVRWSYVLQIRPKSGGQAPGYLRLHLPISLADMSEAEHVLGLRFPPSYSYLLSVTNGLGLNAVEDLDIAGAGRDRAQWEAVTGKKWWEISQCHEITARWLEFQLVYEYERERDAETGIETFLSDPRDYVPFMVTRGGDAWCLTRHHVRSDGEYPIAFWDHELRKATEVFPDFDSWLSEWLPKEVFPDA